MKNLATCKPSEFLVQTNKIRKAVAKWLEVTDIMNIRKHLPKYTTEMTKEERKKELDAQAKRNLSDILDAMLDAHPQETLELIGLMCFVEPEHIDDYPMEEYIKAITELVTNEAVIGFFISLTRLEQTGILKA